MHMQKGKTLTKIKIVKKYITQRTGDSISIFDPEKSVLSTFNNTGTFIFERLKRENSIEDVVKDLVKEFNVTQKTAEKDIISFIEMLMNKGFAQKANMKKNKTAAKKYTK